MRRIGGDGDQGDDKLQTGKSDGDSDDGANDGDQYKARQNGRRC